MPNQNRTGPMGRGPLTGRGFGSCCQRGGCGRGMGFSRGVYQPAQQDLEAERDALQQELKAVEEELKNIKK
ncbi:MAG: DUF5320 domain-containing protein [Patescibacteria group bacterium]